MGRPRVLFWLALLAAAAVTVAGLLVATIGYAREQGPDGAVRGYFAALAAADARTALAYGSVPAGPRTLLTAQVLAEQQRIAPIREVRIGKITRRGRTAHVSVTYVVAFPTEPQREKDTVVLHDSDDSGWRLDAVAVETALHLPAADQRARVAGAPVPTGDTLMFPGAVPITLDTPLLEPSPHDAVVTFGAQPSTPVLVRVSAAGKSAALDAARASLAACYGPEASAGQLCPLPTERYIPGTLRGVVTGTPDLTVTVEDDDPGTFVVSGRVTVQGSYRRLGFTNQVEEGRGAVTFAVDGTAAPLVPVRLSWVRTSS